jgi:N-acetylglucosamine malate deacetylase 1
LDSFSSRPGPVLFLGAHTDDIELGAGGTLARFLREGKEVHCAAFSRCEASLPQGCAPDTLEREMRQACATLGVPDDHVRVYGMAVRHFPEHRQELLDRLLDLKRELDPSLVVAPTSNDVHQDHQTLAAEALRAFKTTSMLAYEMPWNSFHFHTECYVRLTEDDLQRKLLAISCYKTQGDRPYSDPDYHRSHLRMRGMQAGGDLAEAFDVVRWVL